VRARWCGSPAPIGAQPTALEGDAEWAGVVLDRLVNDASCKAPDPASGFDVENERTAGPRLVLDHQPRYGSDEIGRQILFGQLLDRLALSEGTFVDDCPFAAPRKTHAPHHFRFGASAI
jgi:hypothetical protein